MLTHHDLRKIRERRGVTVAKAADICGLNEATVREIENGGVRNPAAVTRSKLRLFYGCAADFVGFASVNACGHVQPPKRKRAL